MRERWQARWLDRWYRRRPGWVDGTSLFHDMCRAVIPPSACIVEIGAGPTNRTSAFLAGLGELHGVDVDDEALGNEHLTKASLLEGGRIPYPDATFDVAVSNYVVEHVRDPTMHLSEIHRVLKPGGAYVFRTPNLWHYVALVSLLTPHSFHVLAANPSPRPRRGAARSLADRLRHEHAATSAQVCCGRRIHYPVIRDDRAGAILRIVRASAVLPGTFMAFYERLLRQLDAQAGWHQGRSTCSSCSLKDATGTSSGACGLMESAR